MIRIELNINILFLRLAVSYLEYETSLNSRNYCSDHLKNGEELCIRVC